MHRIALLVSYASECSFRARSSDSIRRTGSPVSPHKNRERQCASRRLRHKLYLDTTSRAPQTRRRPSTNPAVMSKDHADEHFNFLVQSLPQELFDSIYDLTFTPESEIVQIKCCHKPPHLLAVDRSSRRLFATRYYGSPNGFQVPGLAQVERRSLMTPWLKSVHPTYRAMLLYVEYSMDDAYVPPGYRKGARRWLLRWLTMNGVTCRRGRVTYVTFAKKGRVRRYRSIQTGSSNNRASLLWHSTPM